MALTLDIIKQDVWGGCRVSIVEVTFDSDLDEAGESFTPNDVSLQEFFAVWAAPARAQSTSGAEVTAIVHYEASKLFLTLTDADFAGDNLDASTYSATLVCVGV